ncbi:MAG: hypothetical protein DHS20C01_16940 [marine bacterium B5-7]|nr:MAG: hypothetical protein DHS20C01_16940 [marine bacterium B5-7]
MFSGTVEPQFVREMGYSRCEFDANLKRAFRHIDYRQMDNDTYVIPFEDDVVTIKLGIDRNRRIASLSMPFIEVDFSFGQLDSIQRRAFYTQFQRSFQKGGG